LRGKIGEGVMPGIVLGMIWAVDDEHTVSRRRKRVKIRPLPSLIRECERSSEKRAVQNAMCKAENNEETNIDIDIEIGQ
jgi:hypothetical protein